MVINNRSDIKLVVAKSIKKIINTKYSFLEHIRNYANYLNDKGNEKLLEYGIPLNKLNTNLIDEEQDYIYNHIANDIYYIYE